MKMTYLLIFICFILSSCIVGQGQIKVVSGEGLVIQVSALEITGNTLVLKGENLHSVSSIKLTSGSSQTELNINNKSSGQLVSVSSGNLEINSDEASTITLTNFFSSATYEFKYSLCESTFNGATFDCTLTPVAHDILSFNSSLNKWIPKAPFWKAVSTNVTTNYTLVESDSVVLFNGGSGNLTATLPSAALMTGHVFTIKKTDNANTTITIATTGAQKVEGASTYKLTLPDETVVVVSDGINWNVVSSSGRLTNCPTTMEKIGTGRNAFCIEKASRASQNFTVATNTCIANGHRLCRYQEWVLACLGGAPFTYTASTYEWTSEPLTNTGAGFITLVGYISGNCGGNAYTMGHNGNSYTFRCCLK